MKSHVLIMHAVACFLFPAQLVCLCGGKTDMIAWFYSVARIPTGVRTLYQKFYIVPKRSWALLIVGVAELASESSAIRSAQKNYIDS